MAVMLAKLRAKGGCCCECYCSRESEVKNKDPLPGIHAVSSRQEKTDLQR